MITIKFPFSKAFCSIYWSDNLRNTDDYIVMGILEDDFEVHANEEYNLNLDAKLFSNSKFNISVPTERPRSSKPYKLEKILGKNKSLLSFWLNPKKLFPPPPMDDYML